MEPVTPTPPTPTLPPKPEPKPEAKTPLKITINDVDAPTPVIPKVQAESKPEPKPDKPEDVKPLDHQLTAHAEPDSPEIAEIAKAAEDAAKPDIPVLPPKPAAAATPAPDDDTPAALGIHSTLAEEDAARPQHSLKLPKGMVMDEPAPAPTGPVVPPKRHSVPVGIIALALIVMLALAGGVIYAYMQSQKSAKTTNNITTGPNAAQNAAKAKVVPTDVDSASADVEKDLGSVNETQDLAPADLTDQTLGL